MAHSVEGDLACAVAHGRAQADVGDRTLVAVFTSPVADLLLRYGTDLGYRCVLLEPDPARVASAGSPSAELVRHPPSWLDRTADVLITDHHRPELGPVLRDLLALETRWIGVMGTTRHPGPHLQALAELGVPAEDIARVHRPVGLNIGSRTPAEIAVSVLAGLLAHRNGRPGGFGF